MITKNADGTYTVGNAVTCLSEAAALALLEDTGVFPLVDPLTVQAARKPRFTYGAVRVRDPYTGEAKVQICTIEAA